MYLTPLDKKLLRHMIHVQSTLQEFVIVDIQHSTLYHSVGWEHQYTDKAFLSGDFIKINMKPYEIEFALSHLQELKLVNINGSSPALNVTYQGWYLKDMQKSEAFSLLMTNLFLPAIVAIISSIMTTIIINALSR